MELVWLTFPSRGNLSILGLWTYHSTLLPPSLSASSCSGMRMSTAYLFSQKSSIFIVLVYDLNMSGFFFMKSL